MDALRDINEREGITVITNLHTLDTARAYCERIVGMAGGRVVFDGKPRDLDAQAVRTIYGTDRDGAGIDETVTSTAINIPVPASANHAAGVTPLVLAGH
jgi:phosphonate transport system ATP-binding protein